MREAISRRRRLARVRGGRGVTATGEVEGGEAATVPGKSVSRELLGQEIIGCKGFGVNVKLHLMGVSPKRMELACPICGKVQGSGADQSSHVQLFSSPIIHDLFNDHSWCNE